jgi:hypothetical protein
MTVDEVGRLTALAEVERATAAIGQLSRQLAEEQYALAAAKAELLSATTQGREM